MSVRGDLLSYNLSIGTAHTQTLTLVFGCKILFEQQNDSSIYWQIQCLSGNLPTYTQHQTYTFVSSPALLPCLFLKRAIAWRRNENQIAGDDCTFPSTQPMNAFIVPAFVQMLTIGLKRSFFLLCLQTMLSPPPMLNHPSTNFCTPPPDISGIFHPD